MEVIDLALEGLKLIKPRRFMDTRGFFQQTYHEEQYAEAGIVQRFVQDNWSRSSAGVVRGLHYQYENPQAKLVAIMRGEVFDVVVDLRRDSSTFGKWQGIVLSEENGCQLYVPRGFAHGFQVISDTVDFMYKCDALYAPGDEYGVAWNDPDIGIVWPETNKVMVSEKDKRWPRLGEAVLF